MCPRNELQTHDIAATKRQDPSHGRLAGCEPPSAPPHATPSQHDLQVGMASHCGRICERNEDASLAWFTTRAFEGQPPQSMGLFIVADGMGGHEDGAQASALAIQTVARHILQQIGLPLLKGLSEPTQMPPIHEVLRDSVGLAHQALAHRYPKAGTTLTLALMLSESLYIAHVGDSRAYLGERNRLSLLTHDHSIAARLVEMGQATPEEVTPQRSMLYKAIGQGASVEPDIVHRTLNWGQYLLLCCDGLWSQLSTSQMTAIIEQSPTPDIACQNLVAQAYERDGDDNITVLLVARGWPLPAPQVGDSKVNDGISG